ncbi:MAG: DUF3604 domain-containing protein [Halioglobus sp.]
MKPNSRVIGIVLCLLSSGVSAQQVGINLTEESIKPGYTGKSYSPYAQRDFPSRPFFGDQHVHTVYSMDAALFGNTLGLDESWRFARGEEVTSSTGIPVKLARPLDWMAIADHSDQMGFAGDIIKGSPEVMKSEQGKKWATAMSKGGQTSVDAGIDLVYTFARGEMDPYLTKTYSPGSTKYNTIWQKMVKAADHYNDPGHFTAFIGYEWTSLTDGRNLHRNVIFRDGGDKASQVVPFTMMEPYGSPDPLKLYEWMESYESKTGGSALAIAHNGNLSNGIMFPVGKQFTGRKLDKFYVESRAKWEPLYEVTQIKGDGEAHPFLSSDDEFADFYTWDKGNLDSSVNKTNDMLEYEYAREAMKNGLVLEKKFGTNPYKIGMAAGTDAHTSLASIEEENFFGKHPGSEPSAERMSGVFSKSDKIQIMDYEMQAAGLTAVWATENTRESLYDAMQRKEVYATTGPRMAIRFFGGWDFTTDDINSRHLAFVGYEKGVPMGGDLKPVKGKEAPSFMVAALRDPIGANLDRVQIIKGWLDKKGKTHEKIYNVAWSGDRELVSNGKLPPVGNTVDVRAANWTNTIGAAELLTVWTDPDFDANESAFYYVRVIEIPTPTWIAYDAFRFDVPLSDIPKGAKTVSQERGYTTPIWYTPKS